MKQTIFLFITLLCLSVTLPLLGYCLSGGSLAMPTVQGTVAPTPTHENATPAPTATQSGGQSLADFWDSDGAGTDATRLPQSGTLGNVTQNARQDLAPLLIYDEGSDAVLTVSVEDYLIGAVASELPMTWPDAALQAQAIACHSYILYATAQADPTKLGGAALSADPARRQGFMTDEVLQSYWGADYEANHARLAALVAEVQDVVVLYQGEPAATSYFAISNSVTETSEAVWGQSLPYLTSVDSNADTNADGYIVSVVFTRAQVEQTLATVFGLCTDGIAPSDYFGKKTLTDAGYVKTMEVCGTQIAGTILRSAFSLRSSCFWVDANSDDTFTFTTAGYGHGVGLSQWGAMFMAQDGHSYAEILGHYFPHTSLGSAAALT